MRCFLSLMDLHFYEIYQILFLFCSFHHLCILLQFFLLCSLCWYQQQFSMEFSFFSHTLIDMHSDSFHNGIHCYSHLSLHSIPEVNYLYQIYSLSYHWTLTSYCSYRMIFHFLSHLCSHQWKSNSVLHLQNPYEHLLPSIHIHSTHRLYSIFHLFHILRRFDALVLRCRISLN